MKIVDIERHVYHVPFRNAFSTAHGVMTAREGILVQVTTEQGITGIGEIAPLEAFSSARLADAGKFLADLAARLYNKTLDEGLELVQAERTDQKAGVTKRERAKLAALASTLCGLEIALFDALGKHRSSQVCELLSPAQIQPRPAIAVNTVIGASATGAAIEAAREVRRQGFGCVKLKVGLGDSVQEEVERVAAVRETVGPTMRLRLDANEAWDLEEAVAILSRCVPYAIQYVEQPLKADDLAGMRRLRQQVAIPIAADEAVGDLASARRVLESEAADILVIKLQQAGGLRAGQRMIQEAAQRGVQCVITSSLETGIGVTAALHLVAASPTVTLECGLATLPILADDLVLDAPVLRDGVLNVPMGTGLGVTPDWDALRTYSL